MDGLQGSSAAPAEASSDLQGQGSASNPAKRRLAVTDAQRRELREHKEALMRENGKFHTKQLIDFFNEKYDRVLNQSTISLSLSDKYNWLDQQDRIPHPDSKKKRTSYWPDLDNALFEWEQQMIKQKVTVTNEALKKMAKEIFHKLPQYHNIEPPKFSTGWLVGYRARFQIEKRFRLDHPGAQDRATVDEQLERICKRLKDYKSEDIYNVDETALFWKLSPDATFARETQGKGTLEKASITVIFACNVTGTRKLPLWIIGKAQKPRCFANTGARMENFLIVWQYNGEALMTGAMFEEYLRWFDDQMVGREVCLLIDEFSSHTTGVDFLHSVSPNGLLNTEIIILPTSSTFFSQPLEQGIVRSWKAHYRRRWLAFMCNEFDAGRDPMKSMNVLQAIRWVIAAWEYDVTPVNVRHCWIKSQILGPKYTPGIAGWNNLVSDDLKMFNDTMIQMEQQIQCLAEQKRIKSAMDIATFVSPVGEVVDDSNEDVFESLVEIYTTGGVQRDHETDEEDMAVAPDAKEEALESLSRLRLYEEQQPDADMAVVLQLNKYEREIEKRAIEYVDPR